MMAARRVPGWADVPAMEPENPAARELQGLTAIVSILSKLDFAERDRVLRYIAARYAPVVRLGDGEEL